MALLRRDQDLPESEKAIACERCTADAGCEIWEHHVCYPCARNWFERASVGMDLKDFTAKWITEQSRRTP